MRFEIKVDTSGLDRMLADFPAALARAQSNALKAIGAEIQSQTERAFRHEQMRPSPWAPRKPSYTVKVNKKTGKRTKKLDDHPLLIRSGKLRQSIRWELRGNDAVAILSDAKYAKYHQTGTKHMPARPFFPVGKDGDLTPRARRKIDGIVERALAEELGKIGIR